MEGIYSHRQNSYGRHQQQIHSEVAGGDRKHEMGLDQQGRAFPTPAARDYRDPNSQPLSERGGMSKGEQLPNFIEHHLPSLDQVILPDGAISLNNAPGLRRPVPVLTGLLTDADRLVYYQWACRADQRMNPSLSVIEDEEESLDEPLDKLSPARERKQRSLWAYRQRTMTWQDPRKWTRTAFRKKLNPRFVESLMAWPKCWTSETAVLGPEAMAWWRSLAQQRLYDYFGESDESY